MHFTDKDRQNFDADSVTDQTIETHKLTNDVIDAVMTEILRQKDSGMFSAMFKLIDRTGQPLTDSESFQLIQWLRVKGFVTSNFDESSDFVSIFWGPMKHNRW